MKYNTRIAPSPTGDMHLGTARTAYFNWLAARSTGGKFILRIDDTDRVRSTQQSIDDILSIMDWLNLDYDEVHYQSKRIPFYLEGAETLLDMGWAVKDGDAIRLNLDAAKKDYPDFWNDKIAEKIAITKSDYKQSKDLVLIKSDGFPTYNWASFADDIYMNINCVIRG